MALQFGLQKGSGLAAYYYLRSHRSGSLMHRSERKVVPLSFSSCELFGSYNGLPPSLSPREDGGTLEHLGFQSFLVYHAFQCHFSREFPFSA